MADFTNAPNDDARMHSLRMRFHLDAPHEETPRDTDDPDVERLWELSNRFNLEMSRVQCRAQVLAGKTEAGKNE